MPKLITALLLIACSLGQVLAQELKRESYRVVIPQGCAIDPADADVDLDHLTCVNISEFSSLTITVVDRIDIGAEMEKKMIEGILETMKKPVKTKPIALPGIKPETVGSWSGKFNGVGYDVHICKYTKAINEREEKNIVFLYMILASESGKLSETLGGIAASLELR